MRKLWWRWLVNNKSYSRDYKTVEKARMKRVNAGQAIIFKYMHSVDRKVALMNGTIGSPDPQTRKTEYLWLPRNQHATYDSVKLFAKILAAKKFLPLLMGIDKELDEIGGKCYPDHSHDEE